MPSITVPVDLPHAVKLARLPAWIDQLFADANRETLTRALADAGEAFDVDAWDAALTPLLEAQAAARTALIEHVRSPGREP